MYFLFSPLARPPLSCFARGCPRASHELYVVSCLLTLQVVSSSPCSLLPVKVCTKRAPRCGPLRRHPRGHGSLLVHPQACPPGACRGWRDCFRRRRLPPGVVCSARPLVRPLVGHGASARPPSHPPPPTAAVSTRLPVGPRGASRGVLPPPPPPASTHTRDGGMPCWAPGPECGSRPLRSGPPPRAAARRRSPPPHLGGVGACVRSPRRWPQLRRRRRLGASPGGRASALRRRSAATVSDGVASGRPFLRPIPPSFLPQLFLPLLFCLSTNAANFSLNSRWYGDAL